MTEFLKKITIGLDLLVLLLIFIYTAIYILKSETIILQKIIIFSAIIALIIKMLYWIFDLDETLGYFTELNILWNILNIYQAATFLGYPEHSPAKLSPQSKFQFRETKDKSFGAE